MERVLIGSTTTITETFDADPGATTVTIVDDQGVAVTTGSATGTGTARSFALTPVMTATLNRLRVTWATANLGNITTSVEVVGGFFFSLADFKAVSLGGAKTIGTTYSDDVVRDMRTTVEDAIEHAVGRAFVPRYKRVTVRAARSLYAQFNVRAFDVRAVRWITVGGTGVSAPEIADLTYSDLGYVYGLRTRSSRYGGNIVVGIEHGMDEAPPRVKSAALLLARTWIVKGPVDDRVTTMSSPDTGITAALAVPGRGGSIVGVPEVDAVINEYRIPIAV